MLAINDHLFTKASQIGDGVLDHRQVLVQRGVQGIKDMLVVRFGNQTDVLGTGRYQACHLRIGSCTVAHLAGRPESDQLRVLQRKLALRASEELGVRGIGSRPTAFDEAHAKFIENAGDSEFILDRQLNPLLLSTIAQGGVIEVKTLRHYQRCGHRALQ